MRVSLKLPTLVTIHFISYVNVPLLRFFQQLKNQLTKKNITIDEPAAATMSAKFMHADYHDDSSGGHDGNETLAEYSYSDVNSMELLYTLNRSLHQG